MAEFTQPNIDDYSDSELDDYWKRIFSDLNTIQQRYFKKEMEGKDLFDEADELWSMLFLASREPHAGKKDIDALERIDQLLKEISKVEISEATRRQLSLHASTLTNYDKRRKPIYWDRNHLPTPTDALACLFVGYGLLNEPIKSTHAFILSDYDPNRKIATTNWSGIEAIQGCLNYWNVTKDADRGFGRPKLETEFGQFVNDIWNFFEISGKPSSAMNALKNLEDTAS